MFETSLVSRLSPLAANLYPLVAPKDYVTPACVYNRSDTAPTSDFAPGTTNAQIWLQIDVYDLTYLGAKSLAESIRKYLETWSDNEVQAVQWTNEHDMIDNTTETELYRTMLSFTAYVNLD